MIHLALSDRSLVYCTLKAGVPKAPPRVIEYRSDKHYDKEHFELLNIARINITIKNTSFKTLEQQIGPLFIKQTMSMMLQIPGVQSTLAWLTNTLP